MIKLFSQLLSGELFHFGDKPNRLLIKSGRSHYVAPEGRRKIDPHVAVIPDDHREEVGGESIFERFNKGGSDG